MHKQNLQSHHLNLHNGLILWEKWVLATAVGELVGLSIFALVSTNHGIFGNINTRTMLLLVGALQGAILGFSQWLVLRHYIHKATWWILATTVGSLLAWLIGLAVSIAMALAFTLNGVKTTTLLLGVVWLGAGVGTVLGFAQWLVLKAYVRVYIRQAGWWMAANALAWALGLFVAFMGAGIQKSDGFSVETVLIEAATGAAMGSVIGGITGIVLVWLLKPRLRQSH